MEATTQETDRQIIGIALAACWCGWREARIPSGEEPDGPIGWHDGRKVVVVAHSDARRLWAYAGDADDVNLLVALRPIPAEYRWIEDELDRRFETFTGADMFNRHQVHVVRL